MPREAALLARVVRLLNARGAWHFKTAGTVFGITGLPDIVAIHKGRGLVIETKAPRGRLRPRQKLVLAQAERAGAVVVVARDIDQVRAAVDEIEREAA